MHPDFPRTIPALDLPAALRSVLAAARSRASRAGDREVDTGHLLHSLLESDSEALAAAAPQAQEAARLMGYLVQRSIGFGRRWRAIAEPRAEGTAHPAQSCPTGPFRTAAGRPPHWSAAAACALERAAAGRSKGRSEGLPLLAELTADPGSRAAQILRSAGIDPAVVRARCSLARRC